MPVQKMDISALRAFYNGFSIDEPVGNNAFSFEQRACRVLQVAPLIRGSLADVLPGEAVVFGEYDEGCEHRKTGLCQMVYWPHGHKQIFIFDNHNHAFFFWAAGLLAGWFPAGLPLLHVDQHRDMRVPPQHYPGKTHQALTLSGAFHYANFVLNVGNFIVPALQLGIFSTVQMVDSSHAFREAPPPQFVLDIDIDIFAPEMAYIDEEEKCGIIRGYIERSSFITIATSPYFIDQPTAIRWIGRLFDA